MIVFQAEYIFLYPSFHMLGVAGVLGGSLFNVMHGFLVTYSLIRENTENEFHNEGCFCKPSPENALSSL